MFLSKVINEGASQSDLSLRSFQFSASEKHLQQLDKLTYHNHNIFSVQSEVWRSTTVVIQKRMTLRLCIDPPSLGIDGAIFSSFPALIQASMLSRACIIILRALSIITCVTLWSIALPIIEDIRSSSSHHPLDCRRHSLYHT